MHPWDRSQRKFIGEALFELRPLVASLFARDREIREPKVKPREPHAGRNWSVRKSTRRAETRPNAPLLKRLVRYPFRLDTVSPVKKEVRSAVPWADLHTERIVYASTEIRAGRSRPEFPNPMNTVEMVRLRTRDHRPSLSQWLSEAAKEGDK